MPDLIKRSLQLPLVLFFAALGVRIAYLATGFTDNPLFDVIPQSMDHFNFDQAATAFANGDLLARSVNNSFAPLYKYFLGILYLVLGRNFYRIYMVQFCMGALNSVLIFLITRKLFGMRAGLLAFAGFALYSTEIIYEGILLREAFISFWGVASLYLLLRLQTACHVRDLVAATLAASMFFQGRPNTFLCLPLICVYLHAYVFKKQEPPEKTRNWAVFWSVLLASLAPLLVQCYLVHGKFVFFDASGPHTFISGNLTAYSGVGFDAFVVENYRKENVLGYASNIQYLANHVAGDPVGFLKLYMRKLYFFLDDFEAPSNTSTYLYREFSRLVPWLQNHFALYSALGLVGIALAARNREKVFLLYAYTLSMSLAILIFLNEDRYRIPVVPYYVIFAAYAADRILAKLGNKRFGEAVAAALAGAVLFLAFLEPEGLIPIRADDYNNMAVAWREKNRMDKAVAFIDRSMREFPKDGVTHFNRGQFHFAAGEWGEAVGHYETALALKKDLAEAHEQIVKALFELSRDQMDRNACSQAIPNLEKILRHDPVSPGALLNLGVCYAQLSQDDKARAVFRKVLEIDPDYETARTNLRRLDGLP